MYWANNNNNNNNNNSYNYNNNSYNYNNNSNPIYNKVPQIRPPPGPNEVVLITIRSK